MQRPIKFRAYYQGKWRIIRSLIFHEKLEWLNLEGVEGSVSIGLVKVVQYTGLKDKNGKEIYEGAIFPHEGHNLVVRYECGGFVGSWHGLNEFFFCPDFANVEMDLEVIGNIWENKVALEK